MKDKIRQIILEYGAELCSFANIERFFDTPVGYNPIDVFSECKSVISFGVALNNGLLKAPSRLIYGHFNDTSVKEVDMIAFKSAKKIEEMFRCIAIPIPCDTPYDYWDSEKFEGKGLLSMKHIAVKAGLGTIGKSTLLLNKQYGNMLTLGAILVDLDLASDELAEDVCIKGCSKCIESCPVSAINDGSVNQKLCRKNAYGKTSRGFDTVDCNLCRSVCPINFLGV